MDVSDLRPLSLEELDQRAALLRRTDVKRVVERDALPSLLERLADDHDVLEIDGLRVFTYESVYFDTADLRCLSEHDAGVRPRFKARTRHYVDSGLCLFEVKVKDTEGQTDKCQQEHDSAAAATVTPEARALVDRTLRAAGIELPDELEAALMTSFRRFTLAARGGGARLTVDLDVRLARLDGGALQLRPELVIAETKSEDGDSRADHVLDELGAAEIALSKYRVGADTLHRDARPDEVMELFVAHDNV